VEDENEKRMIMKSNGINIKRLAMGALVALVLLTGFGTATIADAQDRVLRKPRRVIIYRPYRPFYRPYWDRTYVVVDPIAQQREEGYSDGRSAGKEDAKEGNEIDPEDHKDFRKSKSLAYREAFLRGYADGYREKMKDSD
jgi:hypothetical protein